MSIEALLQQVGDVYRELEAALRDRPEVNSCGSCYACCRSEGRVGHTVSEIELVYLERHAGPQDEFRAYLNARDGRTCPHYEVGHGCRVYAWRPYSCRLFGHFREEGTRLPGGCVYTETCATHPRHELMQVVPGATKLKRLQLELRLAQGGPAPTGRAAPSRLSQDALDEALRLATSGDPQGAVQALERAYADYGETPYAFYNGGLIYALAGQPEQSLEAFLRCREMLPDRAEARYYGATQAVGLGRTDLAVELLEEARALAPGHEPTLSLLGSLFRLQGRFAEARVCLLGLTAPLDRFHMGQVWVGLGEPERARQCFQEALSHPPLQEVARQALAQL